MIFLSNNKKNLCESETVNSSFRYVKEISNERTGYDVEVESMGRELSRKFDFKSIS
jgi:hypothetical protein